MHDKYGVVKHLNNGWIHFSVEGRGMLIGKNLEGINPHLLLWGKAPALVRTTLAPGAIKIMARLEYPGGQTPVKDTLVLQSLPTSIPSVYEKKYVQPIISDQVSQTSPYGPSNVTEEEKQKMLRRVEKDQAAFTPGEMNSLIIWFSFGCNRTNH